MHLLLNICLLGVVLDREAFPNTGHSSTATSRALGAQINSEEIQRSAPGDAWAHMVVTRMFLEARDSPEVRAVTTAKKNKIKINKKIIMIIGA